MFTVMNASKIINNQRRQVYTAIRNWRCDVRMELGEKYVVASNIIPIKASLYSL